MLARLGVIDCWPLANRWKVDTDGLMDDNRCMGVACVDPPAAGISITGLSACMSTDQLAERGQGKNRRPWQQVLPQTTVSGRYKFSFKHFDKVTNYEDSISFEMQKKLCENFNWILFFFKENVNAKNFNSSWMFRWERPISGDLFIGGVNNGRDWLLKNVRPA